MLEKNRLIGPLTFLSASGILKQIKEIIESFELEDLIQFKMMSFSITYNNEDNIFQKTTHQKIIQMKNLIENCLGEILKTNNKSLSADDLLAQLIEEFRILKKFDSTFFAKLNFMMSLKDTKIFNFLTNFYVAADIFTQENEEVDDYKNLKKEEEEENKLLLASISKHLNKFLEIKKFLEEYKNGLIDTLQESSNPLQLFTKKSSFLTKQVEMLTKALSVLENFNLNPEQLCIQIQLFFEPDTLAMFTSFFCEQILKIFPDIFSIQLENKCKHYLMHLQEAIIKEKFEKNPSEACLTAKNKALLVEELIESLNTKDPIYIKIKKFKEMYETVKDRMMIVRLTNAEKTLRGIEATMLATGFLLAPLERHPKGKQFVDDIANILKKDASLHQTTELTNFATNSL